MRKTLKHFPSKVPSAIPVAVTFAIQFAVAVPISTALALDGERLVPQATMASGADAVIYWNQVAISAVKNSLPEFPGFPSRNLAIVHAAIYDAVNAVVGEGKPYLYKHSAPDGVDPRIAAGGAAARALLFAYPAQERLIESALKDFLKDYSSVGEEVIKRSLRFGVDVAEKIIDERRDDGANDSHEYKAPPKPGVWQPTPPNFPIPQGTRWAETKLFALPNRKHYLPPPPPALTSERYAVDLNEVKVLGSNVSPVRTPEQTLIGIFWSYDRPESGTTVVHQNQNVETIALQQKNSLFQNARLFILVNIAMADTVIVTWDEKYSERLWRPISAIRRADEDGNPNTKPDPLWLPLGTVIAPFVTSTFTPAFPSYTSGHAEIAGAVNEVLRSFYETDRLSFSITSDDAPGTVRTFSSFSEAAIETQRSRVYLGVHFDFDGKEGLESGKKIGERIFNHVATLK